MQPSIRQRLIPIVATLAALALVVAYMVTAHVKGIGWLLTLDDGYIHARLAENLADTGKLGLNPGEGGGGSSSLLWTMLLAVGAKVGIPADRVAWFFSTGSWLLAVWAGSQWFARQMKGMLAWIAALSLALIGQLAALSQTGMEPLLAAAFVFLALDAFAQDKFKRTLVFASLATLVRAETFLLPLAMLASQFLPGNTSEIPEENGWRSLKSRVLMVGIPFASAVFGYGILTLLAGSTPNTLAARRWLIDLPPSPLQDIPRTLIHMVRMTGMIWERLVNFIGPGFGFGMIWGALVFILAVAGAVFAWKSRWGRPVALFIVMHLAFYYLFLPTPSHMGRYVWPLWVFGPWLVAAGVGGFREKFREFPVAGYVLYGILGVLLLGFVPQGIRWAGYHAGSMDHLNRIHVKMAETVREQVPEGQTVAVFDVGLMSYRCEHKILDMGGLCGKEELKALQEYRMGKLIRSRGIHYIVLPETEGSARFAYAYRLGLSPHDFKEMARYSLGNEMFVHIQATLVAMKSLGLYRYM